MPDEIEFQSPLQTDGIVVFLIALCRRILDEIDPMLSKTAQPVSAPPPSVTTLTTLPASSAAGQVVDAAQIQNLLQATLQASPSVRWTRSNEA